MIDPHRAGRVLYMLGLLLLTGCSSPGSRTDDALDAAARAALAAPIESAIVRRDFAGASLLVLVDGAVVFDESYGVANLDTGRAFTAAEVVMMASSTKPLTASVFAMLHERGVLSLDDSISEYLPIWETAHLEDGTPTRAPTIRELLSHTSGMPSPAAWGGVYRDLLAKTDAPTNDDLSRLMHDRGLAFEPGTDYRYGGVGMSVAARAAEVAWVRATGEEIYFATLMDRLLLDPLGMSDTTFHPSAATLAAMPHRYVQSDSGLSAVTKPEPRPLGTLVNAGGGLVSTARDMAAFYEMIRRDGIGPNGRIMAPSAIALMVEPQSGATGFDMPYADHAYGLGAMLGFDAGGELIHVGHGGAFGTDAHVRLDQGRVVVFITQTPGAQLRRFQGELRDALTLVFGP